MILEKQTNAVIQQEGQTGESISMSLDLDSAQVLMQMLSKNLYSDPIGSTIRECASNALDSHRRAGVDKPIIVSFKSNKENNYEFCVEDFGIGLDDNDVANIISKYGKSTKRNSDTELGMMGLGFKAPLAYTSSFYFVCRKNGVERKYMMYEGEDVNTIDLLHETSTSECNGVKVIVPVGYYDRREFGEKIKEQLAYFENVYFDCSEYVNNDFVIARTELFQFSELVSNNELHICLDNVYYPIDFQKLGVTRIPFSVGLRFGLSDGIFPTPNRESIRYTKESKQIILDRIRDLANYFVARYNETVAEAANIFDIMDYYSNRCRNIQIGKRKEDVSMFEQFATLQFAQPKMKGVEVLDLEKLYRNRDYMFGEYDIKFKIDGGKWREVKHHYNSTLDWRKVQAQQEIFLYSERIPGKKKDYIKEKHGRDTGWGKNKFILKKVREFKLGRRGRTDYHTFMQLLSLEKLPKTKWRQAINEFREITKPIVDKLIDIDKLEIPQDWLDARKKAKVLIGANGTASTTTRRVKLQGEITGKQATQLERWVDGKNCKWVPTVYQLENIHQIKNLVVYGKESDAPVMDKLFRILSGTRMKMTFVYFSERELKNLEKITVHNWINLQTFMKGENKPFKRLVTAYVIKKLYEKNNDVFNRREQLVTISQDLVNKLNMLHHYMDNNCEYADEKVYESMLEVAETHNLFDQEVYVVYKEIKSLCERLPFLQVLCDTLPAYDVDRSQAIVKAIGDLCKYYKQRIDWKNYNVKLNEEIVEKPLTEEEVENLIEN